MNFFDLYFAYAKESDGRSEAPDIFHRWSAITGLGAFLGRNFSFQLGDTTIHPNIYALLIGLAGTKKSTAIKKFKRLMTASGYSTFSAEKSTKEAFLLDLSATEENIEDNDKFMANILGEGIQTPVECFIAADEFNDFFGNSILEFVSMLGVLWDYEGIYRSKVKNSKSVSIYNPTISILGGTTPTNFNTAFPPEIIGQGFFSRLLLIHGESTGHKITIPRTPTADETTEIVTRLHQIRALAIGSLKVTETAYKLLDKIYKNWAGIDDVRFDSYANRRFTHLIKICLVCTAAFYSSTLTEEIVVYANTVLAYAEHFMPKALGEFGKGKNSDVVNKVMQVLEKNLLPMQPKEIWKHVSNDLDKFTDLGVILANLIQAEKILRSEYGFLLKRKQVDDNVKDTVDFGLLSEQERSKL